MAAAEGRRVLDDLEATAALARQLAAAWRVGDVVTLSGPLGAGKTTFARFLIGAMGIEEEVPSPSFNLMLDYVSARGEIRHFDLFRLGSAEEAHELGIEEAFAEAMVLIEWPERIAELLPAARLDLTFANGPAEDARVAEWVGLGEGGRRLARAMAP